MSSSEPLSDHDRREEANSSEMHFKSEAMLFVDLDGSLLSSDILVESAFALLKQNLLYLFMFPVWLARGKANLKQQIADRVDLAVKDLPFNQAFLAYLRRQQEQGRKIGLATASNEKYAHCIAAHLQLFDVVLASDATTNLSGKNKLARIADCCGDGAFDYAGNGKEDVVVWKRARRAILVCPERGVERAAARCSEIETTFRSPNSRFRAWIRAIRLHQWAKNVLVFLPLLAAHEVHSPELVLQALIAFMAFGMCASSVYLLNDLTDLEADRRHPRKCLRPFAAGALSVKAGLVMIPALLAAAFAASLLLPIQFVIVLAGYYLVTMAYSFWLKRIVLVDVLVLAALYTIRVIGGAAAVLIMPSFWLLAFSMFLFLSLAMVKRCAELWELRQNDGKDGGTRGYEIVDLDTLFNLGSASGYMAVLVLALYINSNDVIKMYSRPEVIWLLCPLLLYWISRVWVAVRRGKMHDDPVVFAIRDKVSQLVGVLSALVLLLAV